MAEAPAQSEKKQFFDDLFRLHELLSSDDDETPQPLPMLLSSYSYAAEVPLEQGAGKENHPRDTSSRSPKMLPLLRASAPESGKSVVVSRPSPRRVKSSPVRPSGRAIEGVKSTPTIPTVSTSSTTMTAPKSTPAQARAPLNPSRSSSKNNKGTGKSFRRNSSLFSGLGFCTFLRILSTCCAGSNMCL